jgi:aspartate carbamoyltransferase catalytic subunit
MSSPPRLPHLLGLEGLDAPRIEELLERSRLFLPAAVGHAPPPGHHAHRMVANLFFEDSTRTRSSFARAAMLLGAKVVDLLESGSSASKGETLLDTALNLQAMGFDALVVRTAASGGPHLLAAHLRKPIVSAGDGRHEHPTQGLLDLLTLQKALNSLQGRVVAIVGDIANSRVARSDIHGLTALGADVVLVGPPTLVPAALRSIADGPGRVWIEHDLDRVLGEVDALITLRVQMERAAGTGLAGDFRAMYGLNTFRAGRMKPHAVIMHPGPMNRGQEIESLVADDPTRSVILQQVTHGVAVRMAVLDALLAS